jgi:hypothetical protein
MCCTQSAIRYLVVAMLFCIATTRSGCAQSTTEVEKATEKAIGYLAAETPTWRTEHRCASCHHQGSAVRALLTARDKGRFKGDKPLENSLLWLAQPEKWSENHGDPNASDQTLADLQFGASLLAAQKQFPDRFRDDLPRFARQLTARQEKDGRFDLESSDGLATPITLGPILLTACARDVFQSQGDEFRDSAKRANDWLINFKPRNTFEASSLLIALKKGDAEKSARAAARKIVIASAHSTGGFGPYVSSPAEVFDTALAVIALSRDDDAKKNRPLIDKAKKQLVAWQSDNGSWEETTRPSGSISYAHRIATTSWALEALLE